MCFIAQNASTEQLLKALLCKGEEIVTSVLFYDSVLFFKLDEHDECDTDDESTCSHRYLNGSLVLTNMRLLFVSAAFSNSANFREVEVKDKSSCWDSICKVKDEDKVLSC